MEFLQNLGALDSAEEITGLGSVLANLPVDAIIGKMLIMATVIGTHCLKHIHDAYTDILARYSM